MTNFITAGFITEGPTDYRFLQQIIRRTFESVAFECNGQIEVYEPEFMERAKKVGFDEQVLEAAQRAYEAGLMVLCVHTDADDSNDLNVMKYKFKPAFELVEKSPEDHCKNIVPVVPIHMTEAWMLADKEIIRSELDTDKNNVDLNLHRPPESYADPKNAIIEAIRIAKEDETNRRRREFKISDLYQTIGQRVDLEKISNLPSYQKFVDGVRDAYKKLGYLH